MDGRLARPVGGRHLVVDTTNFYNKNSFTERYGATTAMTLVERFTRIDAETLLYEFTVEDPRPGRRRGRSRCRCSTRTIGSGSTRATKATTGWTAFSPATGPEERDAAQDQ